MGAVEETAPGGTVRVRPLDGRGTVAPSGPTWKLQLSSVPCVLTRLMGRILAPLGSATAPNGGAASIRGDTSSACSLPHAMTIAAAVRRARCARLRRFNILGLSVG